MWKVVLEMLTAQYFVVFQQRLWSIHLKMINALKQQMPA